MSFDFKKEYKACYLPPNHPELIDMPEARYIAVRGSGDPNAADGAYTRVIAALYAVAYAIKMSKMGDHAIDGYFDFVVPPLEGFWRQEGTRGVDYARKADFEWIACIRVPDFVTPETVEWARAEAQRKKKLDRADVEMMTIREGLCVQMMHIGPYDDEPATVARMEAFATESGCVADFSETRQHHEIYLSDPRRTAPEKLKTVVRHPVRRI